MELIYFTDWKKLVEKHDSVFVKIRQNYYRMSSYGKITDVVWLGIDHASNVVWKNGKVYYKKPLAGYTFCSDWNGPGIQKIINHEDIDRIIAIPKGKKKIGKDCIYGEPYQCPAELEELITKLVEVTHLSEVGELFIQNFPDASIEVMENHLRFQPGGEGYEETRKHFESLL